MRFKVSPTYLLRVPLLTVAVILLAAMPGLAAPVTIVGFGDSLMAGYQLPTADTFTEGLQKALKAKGYDVAITNAGVSGDTTSDGLARLSWSVPDGTDAVLLELGGNDALRGISPATTRKNLDTMIARLQARGIKVLLVGILAPPNMGETYASKFDGIFKDLAKKHGVVFYPFFLDGVATRSELQLGDGMHPNAAGAKVIVGRFLPYAERLVEEVKASARK